MTDDATRDERDDACVPYRRSRKIMAQFGTVATLSMWQGPGSECWDLGRTHKVIFSGLDYQARLQACSTVIIRSRDGEDETVVFDGGSLAERMTAACARIRAIVERGGGE